MGDVEQGQPEETPTPEAPEPQEEQVPEEETPPEGAEAAAPEEGEGGEEGEEDPPKEGAAETAAQAEGKHRRKGGWERRAERLEQEKQFLMEQLAASRPAQPAGPAKEPTPDEKAAEYIDALVEQRIQAREARSEQQRQAAELTKKEQAFRATHDDYDEALDVFTRAGLPQVHIQALLTSEHSPAIMYQLAKNPDELARIRALPPVQAALEIGRLDARLASSTATQKTQQPVKSAKRPPAPPTSVGGSSASARNLDDLPISEYKRAFRSKGR